LPTGGNQLNLGDRTKKKKKRRGEQRGRGKHLCWTSMRNGFTSEHEGLRLPIMGKEGEKGKKLETDF